MYKTTNIQMDILNCYIEFAQTGSKIPQAMTDIFHYLFHLAEMKLNGFSLVYDNLLGEDNTIYLAKQTVI